MSNFAVRAEHLSKQYKIGLTKRHDTLRDQIMDPVQWLLRRKHRTRLTSNTIWALKDVSFEVEEREVVGIIGRNGAGKSTVLKILSRITEPTEGCAEIRGRVASLLEVGTGFHPELTGRENIYLNAAILGMKKAEINRKFDEIVAFSEIDRFIDTPVKRYSSGMYVRLAFAVAAHLEPEILIVDEVLAVGDMEFQEKCLGKMRDVTQQGRTVLFVSHNMGAIKSLCQRAMFLEAGRIACYDDVDIAVNRYSGAGAEFSKTGIIPDDARRGVSTSHAKFRCLRLDSSSGIGVSQLFFGQPFRVQVTLEVLRNIPDAIVEIGISTLDGTRVTCSSNIDGGKTPVCLPVGEHTIVVDTDVFLLPRQYTFDLGISHSNGADIDWVERVLDFTVLNVAENSGDHYRWNEVRGFVRPLARWYIGEPAEPFLQPTTTMSRT